MVEKNPGAYTVSRYYNFETDPADSHQVVDHSSRLGNKKPYHTYMGSSALNSNEADTTELPTNWGRLFHYENYMNLGDIKISNREKWAVSGNVFMRNTSGTYTFGRGTRDDLAVNDLFHRKGQNQFMILRSRNTRIGKNNAAHAHGYGQLEFQFGNDTKNSWSLKFEAPHWHTRNFSWAVKVMPHSDPKVKSALVTIQLNNETKLQSWFPNANNWETPSTNFIGAKYGWNTRLPAFWTHDTLDFAFHNNYAGQKIVCGHTQHRFIHQGKLLCGNHVDWNDTRTSTTVHPGSCRRRNRWHNGQCLPCPIANSLKCTDAGVTLTCNQRFTPEYKDGKIVKCNYCHGVFDFVTRKCHGASGLQSVKRVNRTSYQTHFIATRPAVRVMFETYVRYYRSVDREIGGMQLVLPVKKWLRIPARRTWFHLWGDNKGVWIPGAALVPKQPTGT